MKKGLLLSAFGAMLLSGAMLIIPAKAQIASRCSGCTQGKIIAACKLAGRDTCFCPLSNPTTNNCTSKP